MSFEIKNYSNYPPGVTDADIDDFWGDDEDDDDLAYADYQHDVMTEREAEEELDG